MAQLLKGQRHRPDGQAARSLVHRWRRQQGQAGSVALRRLLARGNAVAAMARRGWLS